MIHVTPLDPPLDFLQLGMLPEDRGVSRKVLLGFFRFQILIFSNFKISSELDD